MIFGKILCNIGNGIIIKAVQSYSFVCIFRQYNRKTLSVKLCSKTLTFRYFLQRRYLLSILNICTLFYMGYKPWLL